MLQALQPEWSDCFGDIRGAYDPPKALQAEPTAAGPTQPDPTPDDPEPTAPVTTAAPADSPGPTTPTATGGAGAKPTTTPQAEADQDPALTNGEDSDTEEGGQDGLGVIASLLGEGGDTAEPATPTTTQEIGGNGGEGDNQPNPATPTEPQDAGGVLASLLNAGVTATTDDATPPQGNTVGLPDDPAPTEDNTPRPYDGSDPTPTEGGADGGAQPSVTQPRPALNGIESGSDGDATPPNDPDAHAGPAPSNVVASIGSTPVTVSPISATGASVGVQVAL